MIKIKLATLIFIVLVLGFGGGLSAETIKLKSGRNVRGEIIERTDEYLRLNVNGLGIKYYLDEIESIDGKILSEHPEIEKDEIFYSEKDSPKKWDDWYTKDIAEYIDRTKKILSKSSQLTDQAVKASDSRDRNKLSQKAQKDISVLMVQLQRMVPPEGFQFYHDNIFASCGGMKESLKALDRRERGLPARKLAYLTMAMDAIKELKSIFNDRGASQETIDNASSFIEDVFLK